ncbi:EGF-like domain-containing protein 2 [Patella vulgata]|uniref:EGF-like domain-containing protein 2 n=1 Tax=Patella vulgata TaxID=6465 RepID=UPI00218082F4|nr:EGF-like domain-containing protein 2 [Patella vulgata]
MSSIKVVSVFLVVCMGISAQNIYFNCRLQGHTCLNGGTCNGNTGMCSCTPSHQGYDCGLAKDSIVSTRCDPPCQNGVCYAAEPQNKCYCSSDSYFGEACEQRRAQVACFGDRFNITIVPFPQFFGTVYIKDNRTDDACMFTQVTDPDTNLQSYKASLDFNSGCSIMEANNAPNPEQTTYSTEVTIGNSPVFETGYDFAVKAACIFSDADNQNVSAGAVPVDERTNFPIDQTSTVYEPVKFTTQRANGMAITPPLYIGSPLKLYFTLLDLRKYTKFQVVNCDATNGLENNDEKRVRIIENGCPTTEGKGIFTSYIIYDDIPSVCVYFDAFRFPNSPIVSFACDVNVCKPEDDCAPSDCSVQARTRRSAVSNTTGKHFAVTGSVTVLTPKETDTGSEHPTDQQELELDKENCLQQQEIIVVVIMLAITVVFLLIVTLCFSLSFIKSKYRSQFTALSSPPTALNEIRRQSSC